MSHRGLRRTTNQDAGGAAGWLVAEGATPARLGPLAMPVTVAVADGAGGHPAGEVASRVAVEHVLAHAAGIEAAEDLGGLVVATHGVLHDVMADRPTTAGMVTTLAALVVTERSILAATVGDTRIYELLEDGTMPLSEDDRVHAQGSALSQALGGPRRDPGPAPHLTRLACEPGLRFLLCTDGVVACVDERRLDALVVQHGDDAALARALLAAVLDGGAPDNVTALIVSIHGAQERT